MRDPSACARLEQDTGATETGRIEFMKLEYGAVVEKMAAMRNDLARMETIYPLAMIAIYAWLFTHDALAPRLWSIGMSIPAIIALHGFTRVLGRLKTMRSLERYSRKIEVAFYRGQEPVGWEHQFEEERPMSLAGRARLTVGLLLLLATLCLAAWSWVRPDDLRMKPASSGARLTVPST